MSHLEKVCTCVLKGEWPKMPKIDIQPMVAKLPAYSRPLISTVGHTTSAELTDEKHSRGNSTPNRDFKIKSIDGLKLTVKTDPKGDVLKRKKRGDPMDFLPEDDRKVRIDSIKFIKKPRVERGEMEDSRNVQVKFFFELHLPILRIVKYCWERAGLFDDFRDRNFIYVILPSPRSLHKAQRI